MELQNEALHHTHLGKFSTVGLEKFDVRTQKVTTEPTALFRATNFDTSHGS